jgi:FAD synthase
LAIFGCYHFKCSSECKTYVIKLVLFDAANFPPEVVDNLPDDIGTGIYCGWAKVDDGSVYKMVMSVGWNPYFKNEKKSMVKSRFLFYMLKLKNDILIVFRKHTFFTNLKTIFTGQI